MIHFAESQIFINHDTVISCVVARKCLTGGRAQYNFSDGLTSLREAIFLTNTLIGHDEIFFDPAVHGQTILLTQGELAITDSLNILGPGADLLTIDASGNDPTSLANNGDGSRIFKIDDNNDGYQRSIHMNGLTLTGGDTAGDGGAILSREFLDLFNVNVSGNSAAGGGGGIWSRRLTVNASTISGNHAATGGGVHSSNPYDYMAVFDSTVSGNSATAGGGGIYATGTNRFMRIYRRTIDGNEAGTGGGIYSSGGHLDIQESTLSGNAATGQAGGLFSQNNSLLITSSTISGNSAGADGGGIYSQATGFGSASIVHSTITNNLAAAGGGIAVGASLSTMTLDHTIVAGNTGLLLGRDEVFGAIAAAYSLIGDDTGAAITDNGGNLIGTGGSPIDALLGPLADNGGPTFTHALLPTSPAVDAGNPALIAGFGAPSFDQRGFPFGRTRNGQGAGAQIDIGAFEMQPGTIQGQKWNDLNDNGVKDPDEPGLPGWTIYIDENRNGQHDVLNGLVEPDDYAAGTVLNTIKPGVTLTTTAGGNVFAGHPFGGFASTGVRVFTPTSMFGGWSSTGLRVNFASPTDFVSIDAVSDDSLDPSSTAR